MSHGVNSFFDLISQVLDKGGVKFGGVTYHKECFLCQGCSGELAGSKFAVKDDRPYCQECYVQNFSKRCSACKNPISGILAHLCCIIIALHHHHVLFSCYYRRYVYLYEARNGFYLFVSFIYSLI